MFANEREDIYGANSLLYEMVEVVMLRSCLMMMFSGSFNRVSKGQGKMNRAWHKTLLIDCLWKPDCSTANERLQASYKYHSGREGVHRVSDIHEQLQFVTTMEARRYH
ncbi:hypothetical protein C5167_030014 [Papaver somniferum]|nr:hypothetical protein C5167_030014 [Papaver somniferum]